MEKLKYIFLHVILGVIFYGIYAFITSIVSSLYLKVILYCAFFLICLLILGWFLESGENNNITFRRILALISIITIVLCVVILPPL